MNALNWITKEAKRLRRKYPHRFKKWTDYIKQASAIYATKHGGKSPVGKKRRPPKPKHRRRVGVAEGRKKGTRVVPPSSAVPRYGPPKHQHLGATRGQLQAMVNGVGSHHAASKLNAEILDGLRYENSKLIRAETQLHDYKKALPGIVPNQRRFLRTTIRHQRDYIRSIKRTITELKRHLK